jgi:type I restriction enzyme R subunit
MLFASSSGCASHLPVRRRSGNRWELPSNLWGCAGAQAGAYTTMTDDLPFDPDDAGLPPELRARVRIDAQLRSAGWVIQNRDSINLSAGVGVAVREFLLAGRDEIDYLLFVGGQAVGGVEAKKEGTPLTGAEVQSARYSTRLPGHLQVPYRPLPFLYETTGVETQFTNTLDPHPRSRLVFRFHRPETLARWLKEAADHPEAPTLRARLAAMPAVETQGLWEVQQRAITAVEGSLGEDRPRSLLQMATGSGKTFVAANISYRVARHGRALRVGFLVDRANLGRQTEAEFTKFVVPADGRKFTELYPVQRLTSNKVDPTAKVVVTTIQRLYSVLRGDEDLPAEADEQSADEALGDQSVEVTYNPALPPDFFDILIVDECHRSIYGRWSAVLDYFDAHVIGLTATPSKQTIGFFHQNLVFTYTHEEAVADKVNVPFDVYRIVTEISTNGATIEKGTWANFRERSTRRKRWDEVGDDIVYPAGNLDRRVVSEGQIRAIVQHFRDMVCTVLFPGRTTVPKTLFFAKDDSHAEDIVRIVREEFGRGNDFAVKITYRSSDAEGLLARFRTSTLPRIAVTVDMIATGTDVRPLECLVFMRQVKSRLLFEQMKGRGVRVVSDNELRGVTPGKVSKTSFVLVDAIGVTETEMGESAPLERKRGESLKGLFEHVAAGSKDPDTVASIASRLTRLDRQLLPQDRAELTDLAGGVDLGVIVAGLVRAVDPDLAYEAAEADAAGEPTDAEVAAARTTLVAAAVAPLATNPDLRKRILDVQASYLQVIDTVNVDTILEAGFSSEATDRARSLVNDFETFIADNRDEITALQILYSKPYGQRLTFAEVRELANAIRRPPRAWTPEALWAAYETLDRSRVRGSGGKILTDLVSLVRFAFQQDNELVPFTETVNQRFEGWLSAQANAGRTFDPVQTQWLQLIRDHVAGSLDVAPVDLTEAPFAQHGGLGRARKLFGSDLDSILGDLATALVA